MKVCSFCGTKNDGNATHCASCNATSFESVCENCGRRYAGNFCPNCGVGAAQTAKLCPECGVKYFTNACPNCGYHPGRQTEKVVVREVQRAVPVEVPVQAPAQKNRVGCGTILLWICFPPIMGTVAISRSSMKPVWKAFWIFVLWAALIAFVKKT